MREGDVLLDNDFTAEQYDQQDIIIPEQILGSGTAVTSINGLSGPSITLGGGTTGFSFSVASPNIDLTGTLVAANGGTGQSSYAQGDLLYASGATAISKLAKDTNATRYLSNTGGSNNPAWAQINLANGVTGVLPNANGGMVKINSAAVAPAVTDDAAAGYSVNSLWADTVLDDAYICVDSSNGAAVWKKITP